MPSPWRDRTCELCGKVWSTRKPTARFCSRKCSAVARERVRKTPGRPERSYDADLVERVRSLYEGGMTWAEVQAEIGPGVKVSVIMQRYGITSRPAAPRNNRGEKHPGWLGEKATYTAFHLRVQKARGRPTKCERCGEDDPAARYEWANLTGEYSNIEDYERMCVHCHRRFDADRRSRTGARTSPVRG